MVQLPTYDSTKVSSLSLSTSQLGTSGFFAPGWVDQTVPFTASFGWMGMAFDFLVNNASSRALVLGPRIPFTSATNDLAGTGETATTWDLTISTSSTSIPTQTMTLYGVTAAAPDDFSDDNLPNISTEGSSYTIAAITAAHTPSANPRGSRVASTAAATHRLRRPCLARAT